MSNLFLIFFSKFFRNFKLSRNVNKSRLCRENLFTMREPFGMLLLADVQFFHLFTSSDDKRIPKGWRLIVNKEIGIIETYVLLIPYSFHIFNVLLNRFSPYGKIRCFHPLYHRYTCHLRLFFLHHINKKRNHHNQLEH